MLSKKVILFSDCLGAGGAQRQLVGLAILLKKRDYYVKVSTYYDIDFYKDLLNDACVTHELIPGADNTKKRIWAVRSYFMKERPYLVIAYQETPSLVACTAKVLGCRYKLIVSERNTTQKISINDRIRFFLYHWADTIVPNSYAQGNFIKEHYPWMKKKLRVITNFVDLDYFDYIKREKQINPEIVIAASIWESKNTLGFIRAVKQVVENGYKFHVSWYGKSELNIEYFKQCQDKINELGLNSYIELKEKTKQIRDVYYTADFFCLPSFYEGTPNVICEAISTGLPVVCSDVCDNSIYVKEGVNGYLFNPYDASSIATALEKLLSIDSISYQNMSVNSRTLAEKELSDKRFIDKYLKLMY